MKAGEKENSKNMLSGRSKIIDLCETGNDWVQKPKMKRLIPLNTSRTGSQNQQQRISGIPFTARG